jgi:ribosomal-protein-alanine N-acetyltransferase
MNIFLEGGQIYLRALTKNDLNEDYVSWLNDAEVCEFNSHARFPYTTEKMEGYYEKIQQSNAINVVLAIVDKQTGIHVGNISLQNINWIDRNAEYAILLGNKSFWKKGIAGEASFLICEYGFTRLNLHRIYCGTSAKNTGMKKLAVKMGMKEEGRREEAMFKNGEFVDIVEYGILKKNFNFKN